MSYGVLTTGSSEVLVTGPDGGPLAGATVALSGGAPQERQTDTLGRCTFPQLSPGIWFLTCSLDGYSTCVFPDLRIDVGRTARVEVSLSFQVTEVITVTE